MTAFGPCVGAAYMPPAETPRRCPLPGRMAFILYCRAGDFARRTDHFKNNFYNVRRGQDPALQTGANRQPTGNPARGTPLPGGIYASPTNMVIAYTNQKRCHKASRERAIFPPKAAYSCKNVPWRRRGRSESPKNCPNRRRLCAVYPLPFGRNVV